MARQPRRIKHLLFRSWRRILILLVLLIILTIITKHLPSANSNLDKRNDGAPTSKARDGLPSKTTGENSHYLLPDEAVPHMDDLLQVIPEKFTGAEKCPACLGTELCESIKNGNVRVAFPEMPNIAAQQGIYYGKLHDRPIVVRKVGMDENTWQQFEDYICENTTKSKSCDISKQIVKSFAAQTTAFEPANLRDAYVVAHKEAIDLQFTVCVSESFMDTLKDNAGLGDNWAKDKAAMVYTSMIVSQEVILLKTASMFTKPRPFPSLVGTCGQLVVLDHQGVPLETFISATWEKRAGLALQLLNIIDLFANGDVAWYVIYTDYRFENFDVNSEERVILMDLESMIVIDKETTAQYDDSTSEEPCNDSCFDSFLTELTDGANVNRHKLCAHAPRVVTEAMYSRLCQHILSDLPEHREADDEEADEGATIQPRGFLHSPPKQHKQEISDLLLECVTEAVAGSRMQAVEDLIDILQQYAGSEKDDDQQ